MVPQKEEYLASSISLISNTIFKRKPRHNKPQHVPRDFLNTKVYFNKNDHLTPQSGPTVKIWKQGNIHLKSSASEGESILVIVQSALMHFPVGIACCLFVSSKFL